MDRNNSLGPKLEKPKSQNETSGIENIEILYGHEADADIHSDKGTDQRNQANGEMSLNCQIINYNKKYPISKKALISSFDDISQKQS